jgi:hypothetical protein
VTKRPRAYEVRIRGAASDLVRAEFDDVEFWQTPGAFCLRTGGTDAATLYGLIRRIETLGLVLLNVEAFDAGEPGSPSRRGNPPRVMETSGGDSSLLANLRVDELLAELQGRLEDSLATRDRVSRLFDAVVAVGTNPDIEVVLRGIVEAAVSLVDARFGALGVVAEGGELAEFVPAGLSDEQIGAIHHWPEGRGLLGALIIDPQPIRLADLTTHPDSAGFPRGHPVMRSFIGVPIKLRNKVYGNLYLTEKRGAQFDDEDEAVLIALAAAAAVAIENLAPSGVKKTW